MKDSCSISCDFDTTCASADLTVTVLLDQQPVFQQPIKEPVNFCHEFQEDAAEHTLEFVLSGKLTEHTTVDEQGNIIADACVTISNIRFNDIDIAEIIAKQAVYHHNFNGHGPETQEKFYTSMGCNGSVSLKFTTPMYLWILEHL